MAEIVNLNKARKARSRALAAARAAENRVRHGRNAAERERDRLAAERAARAAEQAKLDPPETTEKGRDAAPDPRDTAKPG